MNKIKELLIFGSGDGIGSLLSGIFWFFLASQIQPNEFGELQWLMSIAGMLSSIALVGNVSTMTVYVGKNIPIQSTLNFISLIFSAILATLMIIYFSSFFVVDSGVLLIAYVINSLVIGDLIGKKRFQEYSKITIIQKALTCGLGFIFFYLFGYETIIIALILTYIIHYKKLIEIFKEVKIDFNLLKNRKEFIINNYFSSSVLVGTLGAGQIDKIIIVPILGFTVLGNYTLGLQMISILLIFSNIFYKYSLSNDASKNNIKNLKIFVVIISVCISTLIFFIGPTIIEKFFPSYIELKNVIGIMALNVIPATISLIFQSKILADERSRVVLISSIISFGVLVISLVSIGSIYGMVGIAFSLLIASISRVIVFIYYIKSFKNSI